MAWTTSTRLARTAFTFLPSAARPAGTAPLPGSRVKDRGRATLGLVRAVSQWVVVTAARLSLSLAASAAAPLRNAVTRISRVSVFLGLWTVLRVPRRFLGLAPVLTGHLFLGLAPVLRAMGRLFLGLAPILRAMSPVFLGLAPILWALGPVFLGLAPILRALGPVFLGLEPVLRAMGRVLPEPRSMKTFLAVLLLSTSP